MFFFFITHFCNDRTTLRVIIRQLIKVAIEVRADLFFRFRDKTQTPAVTQNPTRSTDHECAGIPNGAKPTGVRIELRKSLFAPGEMIEFLIGRTLHLLLNICITGDRCMPLIQALRGDLTGMIHAH